MKVPPFFSVVIPVHNKAPHLQRSISSVLAQTFEHLELLLVDDASTDSSLVEMKKYFDPRIRILQRESPGPGGYAARNLAAAEAKAEWLAFLDADDEWLPDHLAKMKELVDEFPLAAVMGCGYQIIFSEEDGGKETQDIYFAKRKKHGNHYLSFKQYLESEVQGLRPIWTSVACIRKPLLLEVGGFPEGKAKRGGDVDTWLRCIEKSKGIAWGSYIGAIYYRDSINMCTRTEVFMAEVERNTVTSLLPNYGNETRKLLKKFANKRTISAWQQNHQLSNVKNFTLLGRLYLDVDTFRNLGLTLLSLTPKEVFLGLMSLKNAIKRTFS